MSLDFLGEELEQLQAAGLKRQMRIFDSAQGPQVQVEGREAILLSSNAYLGLNTYPKVVAAAQQAVAAFGTGSGGSRLTTGTTRLHRELEGALATFKGAEDAVVFGTGYQANVGVITGLTGPEDLILSDALNHASIVDACRLSRARTLVYRHRDVEHLGALLRRHREQFRRCLVVTDGVFSMDGDVAPLPDICQVAARYGAQVMVDDAHGTGVMGPGGRGTVAHFGLNGRVAVQVGTLSKALASEGGFVAGSATLCQYLRNRARPFIFSTAPAPASMAAAMEALTVLMGEPDRVKRLQANASRLRRGLMELGYQVMPGETPIIPVIIGEPDRALALAQELERSGVFVPAIRPPSVPPGTSRLRVTVMAAHTERQLDQALAAFAAAGRAVGVIR